jgi:hypothetical protein
MIALIVAGVVVLAALAFAYATQRRARAEVAAMDRRRMQEYDRYRTSIELADSQIGRLLDRLDREREAARSEQRELINRITHPQALPVSTAKVPQRHHEPVRRMQPGTMAAIQVSAPRNGASDDLGSDVP